MNKLTKQPARRAVGPAAPPRPARKAGRVDRAALLGDLRALVQSARERIATAANATYTLLCWQVGCRLLAEDLQSGRAAYGKQILATVSQELTLEFGMLDFCGHEPVLQMYRQLCRHYWLIDPVAAAFYVNAYRERWGADEPEDLA